MRKLIPFLIFGLLAMGCATQPTLPETLSVNDITSVNLKKSQNVLLDVRTPEEFDEGHLPGAKNIDFFGEDFENQIDELDKKKTYFIYCKAGNRSTQATELMKDKGFENVVNLKDGYDAYEE